MSIINFYNSHYKEVIVNKPDNYYDWSLIDPPYGIGESNKKRSNFRVKQKNGSVLRVKENCYTPKNWDKKPFSKEDFYNISRVSQNVIIFGANYYELEMLGFINTKPPRRNEYDEFLKNRPYGFIIWDKMNRTNDFSDCEIIYVSKGIKSRVVYYMWNGMFQGEVVSYDYNKANRQIGNKEKNEVRRHPTQKPVIFYRWLIIELLKEGEKVFDPYGGSLNSAIACDIEGFDLDICEIDKEYFDPGVKAFDWHKRQQVINFKN